MRTTIVMSVETRKRLSDLKTHPRETYEDVIKRLIEEHEEGTR